MYQLFKPLARTNFMCNLSELVRIKKRSDIGVGSKALNVEKSV